MDAPLPNHLSLSSLEDNANNYASSNSSNSPKMPFSTFSPIATANNNNSPARKPPMVPQVLLLKLIDYLWLKQAGHR